LGVCLGIQVMNVEFGGSLLQHIPEDLPGALEHEEEDEENDNPEHPVKIEAGTILARVLGGSPAAVSGCDTVVNSFHHQSVDRVAPGFRVAARAATAWSRQSGSDAPLRRRAVAP
jgi:putative glutamine amidotransferase